MQTTVMKRFALLVAGLIGLASGAAVSAEVRTQVVPYLEVEQIATTDVSSGGSGGGTTAYTSVAAGIDASFDTRRVQGQVSYRYEHRFSWKDDLVDDDVHSGVAQMRVQVVPNTLAFDAGALAARARGSAGGPILGVTTVNDPNAAEVYSGYAGPSLTTHVGPVDVAASYRIGYIHVDDNNLASTGNGGVLLDRYDDSVTQDVAASIGMKPGELPFGWTVGAGYVREDVDRLDQNFEGEYVRGDIVVPVTASLALTGGVGYEKIEASQQDFQRTAGGVPIVSPDGHLIADPTRPRLLTYDTDGLIWDAGVIYRPSRRTELQARVGERYGSISYTGSLRHQFNSAYGVTAEVYDSVDSFGRLVVSDLRDVPTHFNVRNNPLNSGFAASGGCLFGTDPGQGVCFDDALQSIAGGNFRNRGATILFSGGRGLWSFDFGGGYSNREYFVPAFVGNTFVVNRVTDESWTVQADATRRLGRNAAFTINAFAGWFDSDRLADNGSFGTGLTGSYTQSLLFDRLQFEAAAGIYHTEDDLFDSTFLSGLVGLRYSF